jgi:tetratricopeptide (TPR) repeat protein
MLMVCLPLALGMSACAGGRALGASAPSLETQIGKVRALTEKARPKGGSMAVTLESWDPRLAAALTLLASSPGADAHRAVAAEYQRLGVLDRAHAHLTDAVRLDPADAAAHDQLARIWRDWGFPHLGLDDARRAVALAPDSPAAANTLGTLYAAAGHFEDAAPWYARAVALDPNASYALNNLCYAHVRLGRRDAVATCERAVAAQPSSRGVRNNLSLALAAVGDLERARLEFARDAEPAPALYNLGLIHLAQGRYEEASGAFEAALAAEPYFPLAAARLKQSQALRESGGLRP